jgi:drug/metabolite transporter (DMT)-like permease
MEKLIPLFASILLSTGLFAVFKFIGKRGLEQFPIIIINYITCFVLGNLVLGERHLLRLQTLSTEGFLPLVSLGILFVGTFFLMAKSTNESGAAASSMASKMSMIIPIIASVLFWGETISIQMILGIVLAIASVYIISRVGQEVKVGQEVGPSHPPKKFNVILILVFLGSGTVDTLLNVFKQLNYNQFDNEQKAALTFGGAMVAGLLVWMLKPKTKPKTKLRMGAVDAGSSPINKEEASKENQLVKSDAASKLNGLTLFSGIVLGTINFYSVVALYAALDAFKENTAVMFSMNNVGVVVFSTVVGWLFGERPVARVFWGMGLAILSIIVLAF